jgi:methionine sulfoxide reductase heme-binding subunit
MAQERIAREQMVLKQVTLKQVTHKQVTHKQVTPAQLGRVKLVLFVACLLPLLRLLGLGFLDRLGANPIEFITRSTGLWALVMLCITLAITPLRQLSGWAWLVRLRRMLGLFCFMYVMLHMLTWIWFDHWFEVTALVKDVWKRPFITVGFLAMLLLWPLALTSNQWAMRRLGRRWSQLHRLVYLIALLGLLHFWWMRSGKNNFLEPFLYSCGVAVLLAYRLRAYFGKTDSKANKSTSFSR